MSLQKDDVVWFKNPFDYDNDQDNTMKPFYSVLK